MYGICTYIEGQPPQLIGKYASPMEGLGRQRLYQSHVVSYYSSWLRGCAPVEPQFRRQDVAESAERRLPEFTTATQAEKFKEQEKSATRLCGLSREKFHRKSTGREREREGERETWMFIYLYLQIVWHLLWRGGAGS